MSEQNYDEVIIEHYRKAAEKEGLGSNSTMADAITREKETRAIIEFVGDDLNRRERGKLGDPATIMDIGCGNGYSLEVLSKLFPENVFVGIEKSDDLRALALSRFKEVENVSIIEGDIRDRDFAKGAAADILICQRVLINLLNVEDQKTALNNIIGVVRLAEEGGIGGALLFIEAFASSLATLNIARDEFDIPPMKPAHHNLYLEDGFFETEQLSPYPSGERLSPPNFLSTHYFVTRVLHPIFTKDKEFKRNSEFVRFFTQSLKENVGDYSPLRLCLFEKKQSV
jgi:SAM-dependent methyltransferase